jgi:hypothetical protein
MTECVNAVFCKYAIHTVCHYVERHNDECYYIEYSGAAYISLPKKTF